MRVLMLQARAVEQEPPPQRAGAVGHERPSTCRRCGGGISGPR